METETINLEKAKDSGTIKEIILKVVGRMNVNQIYLTTGEREHPFTYRLTVITEDMAKIFREQVGDALNELLKDYPQFYARFFTLHYVRDETNLGNTFFLNTCTEENLVYCHSGCNGKWLFQNIDLATIIKRADRIFLAEMERIQSFKKGAELFLGDQNYKQAAFMLHQTIELSYLVAERLLTGTTFKGHSISDHQSFIGQVNKEMGRMLPKRNDKEIRLLQKLDQAYIKSRYRLDYEIEKGQVNTLNGKAEKLISKLGAYIDMELTKCQKVLELTCPKATEDSFSNSTEAKNGDEPSLLERIRALSKENLKKLTPIGGGREGHYLNYFRVYDYLELFDTLRATLNICILALDEQLDCTLDIRRKELDVKKVLIFARNLVPFEESLYLDEMRKLMLSEKETERDERF